MLDKNNAKFSNAVYKKEFQNFCVDLSQHFLVRISLSLEVC